MPTIVKTLAPAKINLTFDILGLLPGGYHEVITLLQSIDLEDELTFEFSQAEELSVSISCDTVPAKIFPTDDSNLISKAAKLFVAEWRSRKADSGMQAEFLKIKVQVEKVIPIGAGLAGGSADAAATLVALNHVYGMPFSADEMNELAAQLGADVPFCLQGGTAVGTHRGDRLQALPEAADTTLFYCVVKPRALSVSTPWAFKKYDEFTGTLSKPDCAAASQALADSDLPKAISAFGNVFEPVIFAQLEQLQPLKDKLVQLGAWCCHLSGSGPALYAVVANREHAHYIRRKVMKNDDDGFEYGSAFSSFEYGPPIQFHIAQSVPYGARVSSSNVIDGD